MKMSELTKADWEVAKKRAESLSEDYGIGMVGRLLTKKDLLDEIDQQTDVGRVYAESQKEFLRWLVKRVGQDYV